jgi:glutamine---fructose-6-phosphate transaminase (isomerizing)
MNVTERVIFEQFPFWLGGLDAKIPDVDASVTVIIGCGTSFNLAVSLAAIFNAHHRRAIAVPGGEWLRRPDYYLSDRTGAHIVALSRSGETTETIAAAVASRAEGLTVTALTCQSDSALAHESSLLAFTATHPEEGIVMTSSASLMLLLGLRMAGVVVPPAAVHEAEALTRTLDVKTADLLNGRSHFVYLGGGALYGVCLEASLKLQEMSQSYTQAYHPLEYRHGPVSLLDERTLVVMLYDPHTRDEEAQLVQELRDKGAVVIGFGGPGDITLPIATSDDDLRGLVCLPALQLFGERVAQHKNLDTVSPRHLTKVVKL